VAGASLTGGALLGLLGQDRDAYVAIFTVSVIARLLSVSLLLARARRGMAVEVPPLRILAIRPWGEAIVRPVIATLDLARRLGRAGIEMGVGVIRPPENDPAGRLDPPRRENKGSSD
jgi:hypothetical protein